MRAITGSGRGCRVSRGPGRGRSALGCLLVAACLACTTPASYYIAAGHEGAPGVRRVLLCPLNLFVSLPAEISDGAEPVHRALVAYLEEQGLEVEHLGLSEGRWRWKQAGAEAKRQGSADAAAALFVQDMASRREFQALLVPSLILLSVRVVDSSGSWDGVRRRLSQVNAPSMGRAGSTDVFAKGVAYGGIEGKVLATSLHLMVFSPDGQRVFEGRGGLDFIQEIDLTDAQKRWRWELRMKRRVLRNPEAVREGVEIALGPYLPSRSER